MGKAMEKTTNMQKTPKRPERCKHPKLLGQLIEKTAKELLKTRIPRKTNFPESMIFQGDCERLLDHWIKEGRKPFLDLVFTSPPYNLGKEYEQKTKMAEYCDWQKRIVRKCVTLLKPTGSIVWQVGNYVANGHIRPLDIELAPISYDLGLQMRNRVIWAYGHGMHCKQRFSGRYEVAMWFTKNDDYTFNLDPVRIPSKWPDKKHFKGPNRGQISGNPLGKNPEDVWQIPHVQSSHPEKTEHPCQFPLELARRFILALTNEGDVVFDPFGGSGTTAAASALTNRKFYTCDTERKYNQIASIRAAEATHGVLRHRKFGKPVMEPQINLPEDDHLSILH